MARDLSGSEYLELIHGKVAGRPSLNLKMEKQVQHLCRQGISKGWIRSAHDCSDGGLAVALLEACIPHNIGVQVDAPIGGRWDAALFGERQSRIVISVRPEHMENLISLASEASVPWTVLGHSQSDQRLTISGFIDIPLDQLKHAWQSGLGILADKR